MANRVLASPKGRARRIFDRTMVDHGIGFFLALAYCALLIATANELAMSRDEGFYVVAAERYGGWFEQLFEAPAQALERASIDRAWSYNREHPPLTKSLFAISLLVEERYGWFGSPGLATRFPAMAMAGAMLWMVFVFGARAAGRGVGLFAALALGLMPRVFYHAHLACFDIPIVFWLTVVSYCYWQSLLRRRWLAVVGWQVALGSSYGLALATKHNAWILPGVFAIHWIWAQVRESRSERTLSRIPWWLLSMAFLGVLLCWSLWPWMWHDTADRFADYVAFHVRHEHYNFEYFGQNIFQAPVPISVPWVMTALTIPLTVLMLAALGIGRCFWKPWISTDVRSNEAEPMDPRAMGIGDPRRTAVLWLGLLFAPLVAISLPSTPVFGGTKHWMPGYPFLALFAGIGCFQAVSALRAWTADRMAKRPWTRIIAPACGGLLLAPSAVETVHSHPLALSHYGVLAGGVAGAADLGMNRQFWGFTQGRLAGWFRRRMPQGGRVWPCDTLAKAWEMMQRDGMLPENIRATFQLSSADYAIVHHELHFADIEHQIWQAYGTVQPVHVLTFDGVPIVSVYKNPRKR